MKKRDQRAVTGASRILTGNENLRAALGALQWLAVRLVVNEICRQPLPRHSLRRFRRVVEREMEQIRQCAFAPTTPRDEMLNQIGFGAAIGRLCAHVTDWVLSGGGLQLEAVEDG